MSEKIPTKRTPITRSKEARKDSDTPKIRPGKEPDARVNHGVNSLDALLKQNLDGRLAIVRKRDQLESQLINHAGGLQAVTPSMLLLIRRIVHKTLVCDQAERMSLLGRYDFSGK